MLKANRIVDDMTKELSSNNYFNATEQTFQSSEEDAMSMNIY